jgi:putative flippase GtrA
MFDWRQLLSPDAPPLAQFIKYAICGGIATVTQIVIFHLIGWRLIPCLQPSDPFVRYLRLSVPPVDVARRARNSMLANIVGFIFSNFVAYLLNILFVFKAGRYPWWLELEMFYAVSAVSLLIGSALMCWMIKRFNMMTTIAFGGNLAAALLINYAMRRFVIFNG